MHSFHFLIQFEAVCKQRALQQTVLLPLNPIMGQDFSQSGY